MNIKSLCYESLNARQRVIAAIEAEQRNDWEEIARLQRTAPRKSYRMIDADVADAISAIHLGSVAFSLDIANQTVNLCLWLNEDGGPAREDILQTISALQEAKVQFLGRYGIPRETAASYGPALHHLSEVALRVAPEPDPERVAEILLAIDEAS